MHTMDAMETKLDLHLFDGEGGGGATAGAGAAEGAGDAQNGAAIPATTGGRRGRNNPLAGVVYGKQSSAAEAGEGSAAGTLQTETSVEADTEAERRAAFEKLVKGEYKDLYDARVQQHLDRRFRQTQALEEQLGAAGPILDMLKQKYGAKDIQTLAKAIEEDDSYYEQEANEKGMTVEQLKAMKKLERENAAFKQAQKEQEERRGQEMITTRWQHESEQVAQLYQGFDFDAECQSPETGRRFLALLGSGVDVKTAYEVIHKDELLSGAIGYAVKTAQQRTINNIRARGMRPAENGASGSAAASIVKSDPSKWTKADRAEIARRVARGERIEL